MSTLEHDIAACRDALPQLLSRVAQKRRDAINGGTTVMGVSIDTSPESQAAIGDIIVSLERGYVSPPIRFKSKSGWVDLDLAAMNAVASTLAQHVQACFAAEADHAAAIEALADEGKLTEMWAYDYVTTGWPSPS